MGGHDQNYHERIERLKHSLVAQGRRVQQLIEKSFDAVFNRDGAAAREAIALDEDVDRVDIALEKTAVQLLADACASPSGLAAEQLRSVLTVVKINNELERIADVGVAISEQAMLLATGGGAAPAGPAAGAAQRLPGNARMLANSAVGILRDATTSFDRLDPELAKVVLLSEEAVRQFKKVLVREAQEQLAKGKLTVDEVLSLSEVATLCEVMADHCTNIAEQVMYVATGTIVRHMQGHWEEVRLQG